MWCFWCVARCHTPRRAQLTVRPLGGGGAKEFRLSLASPRPTPTYPSSHFALSSPHHKKRKKCRQAMVRGSAWLTAGEILDAALQTFRLRHDRHVLLISSGISHATTFRSGTACHSMSASGQVQVPRRWASARPSSQRRSRVHRFLHVDSCPGTAQYRAPSRWSVHSAHISCPRLLAY